VIFAFWQNAKNTNKKKKSRHLRSRSIFYSRNQVKKSHESVDTATMSVEFPKQEGGIYVRVVSFQSSVFFCPGTYADIGDRADANPRSVIS
jgi:hypothetical protein